MDVRDYHIRNVAERRILVVFPALVIRAFEAVRPKLGGAEDVWLLFEKELIDLISREDDGEERQDAD